MLASRDVSRRDGDCPHRPVGNAALGLATPRANLGTSRAAVRAGGRRFAGQPLAVGRRSARRLEPDAAALGLDVTATAAIGMADVVGHGDGDRREARRDVAVLGGMSAPTGLGEQRRERGQAGRARCRSARRTRAGPDTGRAPVRQGAPARIARPLAVMCAGSRTPTSLTSGGRPARAPRARSRCRDRAAPRGGRTRRARRRDRRAVGGRSAGVAPAGCSRCRPRRRPPRGRSGARPRGA